MSAFDPERTPVERRRPRRGGPPGAALFNLLGLALVLATAPVAWLALDVTRPAAETSVPTSPVAILSPTPTGPIATATVAPTPTASPTKAFGDGTWHKSLALDKGRWGAGIALLADGQVLIVGGTLTDTSQGATASTRIVDPQTGGWTTGPDMTAARAYPMAIALNDHTVLVTGGSAAGKPLASAEIYDATTKSWTPVGRMTSPRTHGTATLLADGRVLVAGGGVTADPTYASTNSAEIYNPATRTWTATGSMSHARALHSATALADGRVLVTGGANKYHDGGAVTSSAEIYDPRSGRWEDVAGMAAARYTHSAVRLPNGRVLVAGGWSFTTNNDPSLASAEVFDPASNSWSSTGDMSTGRGQFRMAIVKGGRVIAAGGVSPTYGIVAGSDLYDPATGSWTPSGILPEPVMWPAMIGLEDGRALIAGGALNASAAKQSAMVAIYDPPPPAP